MSTHTLLRRGATFALAATLAAACRHASDRATDRTADSATAPEATTAAKTPAHTSPPGTGAGAADAGSAPLTVGDVDRWQRGMTAELDTVRAAETRLAQAKSAADSAAVHAATSEIATRAAGARAAGVDESRYQQLRTDLALLAGYMAPIEQEMDVSKLPGPMVAQMRQGREADLSRAAAKVPPDVVAALRPRAAALRVQERALLAERFKALGAH